MKTPVKPSYISKGKKIVHFCNYSPVDSGMYKTVQELVYEELKLGYDAWIMDTVPDNPLRRDSVPEDSLFEIGRIAGIEQDRLSADADLICWHSWIPENYLKDRRRNLVMFLHGMPSFVFYNELYNIEPVLSFLRQASKNLTHCHNYISLWPSHEPYWRNFFQEKLVVSSPWISLDSMDLKSNAEFDPSHMKLAVMDTWRGGKEPYYIINAVLIVLARVQAGSLPFRVTLDIYGQDVKNVQPVWHTLIPEEFKGSVVFQGKDKPERIFDAHDILLTQIGDESRIVREGLLSGTPLVSGYPYADWTPFRHDCRDIEGYADEILRCWESMRNREQRQELFQRNRDYAFRHFDISRNAVPIFECYERIFKKSIGKRRKGPSLSLCMTVKDEEECLQECLAAVQSLVDEIVVVDTGSTDRTPEIAESFGAKVIHHPCQDDFSEARNLSLDQADSDWILVLDADEIIAASDLSRIRALIARPGVTAYRLMRRTYLERIPDMNGVPVRQPYPKAMGAPGYFPSPLVRLFRNHRDIRFEGRVHEAVDKAIGRMGGTILDMDIPILHYGKLASDDRIRLKNDVSRRLGEAKLLEEAENSKSFYELGIQYMELEAYEKAASALEKAVSLAPGKAMAHFNLALVRTWLGRPGDAIECYHQVLKLEPQNIGAFINLASLLEKEGRIKEVEPLYRRAIHHNPGHYVLHYKLATFLRKQKRLDEAVREYRVVLSLSPDMVDAHFSLGTAWIEKNDTREAAKCFQRVLEIDPGHNEARETLYDLREKEKLRGRLSKDSDHVEQIHAGIASAYKEIERIKRLLVKPD